MRPEKIIMTGFGPYANRTEVDMSQLGTKGIYLITGDTGAGKTTIFDAITYALFGEASGKNRESSMLRSKFADEETPTEVELFFTNQNKSYYIKRNPTYQRKKTKGEGLTTEKAQALLSEIDDNGVSCNTKTSIKEVDVAIKEILGLDREQFSQIAMLAQGAFLDMLFADTNTRAAIFREIFKTEFYLTFQNKLKEEVSSLSKIMSTYTTEMNTLINGAEVEATNPLSVQLGLAKKGQLPIGQVIQLIESILAEDNDTKENFDIKLDSLKQEIEANSNIIEAGKRRISISESIKTLKEKLSEIKDPVNKLQLIIAELQEKKPEMEIKKTESIRLEQALEVYLKQERLIERDEKLAEENRDQLKQLQDKYIKENKKYNDAKLFYDNMNEAYLAEQAGVLAEALEEGNPCPVCGATHHPSLAHKTDQAPTKEDLKIYKKQAEALGETVQSASQNANIKRQEIKLLEERIVEEKIELENVKNADSSLSKLLANSSKAEAQKLIADLKSSVSQYEKEVADTEKKLKQYKEQQSILSGQLEAYENSINELPKVDISLKTSLLNELRTKQNKLTNQRDEVISRINANTKAVAGIRKRYQAMADVEKKYQMVKNLADTARGDLTGKTKIKLETYVQTFYFDRVIQRANVRFLDMTDGHYELKRCQEASDKQGDKALDLSIIDHYSGSERSVRTLSGGESFEAALAMALAFSEEITESTGGIRLDTLFVDEGFGSLDEVSLDKAIRALEKLSDGNRLVGIISHVGELKKRIDRQIVVSKSTTGESHLEIIL